MAFFPDLLYIHLTNGQNTFAWSSRATMIYSLIYSLHIDDLCVFSEIVVCFFSAGYFFPHILLTKMARKNGKFLSTIFFFQGCLPKLHHIIVKSYNKNKIQFLPFLHLIEKLFLCISLPLFCNTWYSTKVCKYVATTYF